jgi:hypothetical protein
VTTSSSSKIAPLRTRAAQDRSSKSLPRREKEGIINTLASFQTLLNISEKALDGLPIWGPKAAVSATAEALKIIRVD